MTVFFAKKKELQLKAYVSFRHKMELCAHGVMINFLLAFY